MLKLRAALAVVLAVASTGIQAAPRLDDGRVSTCWEEAIQKGLVTEAIEAQRKVEARSPSLFGGANGSGAGGSGAGDDDTRGAGGKSGRPVRSCRANTLPISIGSRKPVSIASQTPKPKHHLGNKNASKENKEYKKQREAALNLLELGGSPERLRGLPPSAATKKANPDGWKSLVGNKNASKENKKTKAVHQEMAEIMLGIAESPVSRPTHPQAPTPVQLPSSSFMFPTVTTRARTRTPQTGAPLPSTSASARSQPSQQFGSTPSKVSGRRRPG